MIGCELEFKGIVKEFPGVLALDNVGFKAMPGEVLALMGENGAGKSTLLKILNGDYKPDSGQILIDRSVIDFQNPMDALNHGVSIIYQERHIVPDISIAENVFAGHLPMKRGIVDWKRLYQNTQQILDELNILHSPTTLVKSLSVAEQQMVEIAKDYNRKTRIMAFDEPTASLSEKEIEVLFSLIRKLRERWVTIIYVSHRMNEVFEISDRVAVLKDGRYVDTLRTRVTTERKLVHLMVGREIDEIFSYKEANTNHEYVLEVEKLSNEYLQNVSLTLRKGETLGIAGLVGAGRSELAQAIFGADKIDAGTIKIEGKKVDIRTPKDAIQAGIAFCPEDRKTQALIMEKTIRENISQIILKKISRLFLIDKKKEQNVAEVFKEQMTIRTPSIEKKVKELSGGNQQKVVLSRWLSLDPKIIILDEPTRGIDVGAKSEIYNIINDLKSKGVGIIVISSELPEVISVSDRVVVMRKGAIAGVLDRDEASEEKVIELAMLDRVGEEDE